MPRMSFIQLPQFKMLTYSPSELGRVLSLFRESVLIMDEVDLILHPLKSELNFPIGTKLDLDFHPLRWYVQLVILLKLDINEILLGNCPFT